MRKKVGKYSPCETVKGIVKAQHDEVGEEDPIKWFIYKLGKRKTIFALLDGNVSKVFETSPLSF